MIEDNLCAVLNKIDDLRLENRKVPEPQPNEVLLEMQSVGICGSDVHYWKNGRIGDFIVKEPMIVGHESSGKVVKIGKNVHHLREGDRVAIEPGVPCGKCEFCKKGSYNICPDIKFCATPPYDGSLCRYYCHDADYCFKLPDNVSYDEGAMIEPLSVAVYGCKRSGVTAGKSVLICGAGPIGLLNILTCKAMGVSKICVTDILENRLSNAQALGAKNTVCVKNMEIEAVMKEVISRLGGQPDITLECSGAEPSVKLGMKVTKPGGVLMLIGLGAPEIKIPIIEATIREVDIRGIFRYVNCYPIALELVSSGAINLKPLITHHFTLEESIKAFETAHTGAGGAIKVMIHCGK
ncbi:sorbitol dehydrogenase isoform X1 [Parasteatoda tepidariorum]|uniref:sorbitol dehydrogenase isoform X1 n=2 Tax=Parasteatoda tepidariorum TaxID=114398 RepID=UPI001C72980A|nr:sorbitol dehydrogenase [Parasteatoda tepidariorum]